MGLSSSNSFLTLMHLVTLCSAIPAACLYYQVIPLEFFEGQSADGQFVPIVAGGSSLPLTFNNRRAYVDCAIQYRLHEMDIQVGCVLYLFSLVNICLIFCVASLHVFFYPCVYLMKFLINLCLVVIIYFLISKFSHCSVSQGDVYYNDYG